MKIDRKRLTIALSAIWVIISIPISEHLYQEALDGGLLMRIFALIAVAIPVWLHYGLQWITNEAAIQRNYLIGILVLGGALSFMTLDSRYWGDLAYIPIITTLFFAVLSRSELVFSGQAIEALHSQKTRSNISKIAPEKLQELEAANNKARPLLNTTQNLANDILTLLHSHGGRSPVPEVIFAEADALKTAYALVYAAYIQKCVRATFHHHTAILVMYQAIISQNLIPLILPKIPNTPSLRQSDLENESFRAPVREMLKRQSKHATEALAKIEDKNPNPFLPIYQNLRPYFSPETTDDELSKMFEVKFNDMFVTAKKEVFQALF